MTRASQRALALGACIAVGAGLLSGCTSTPRQPVTQQGVVPAGEFRLLAFDSCETALTSLHEAASETVGPYGLPGMYGYRTAVGGVVPDMAMDGAAGAPGVPQAEAGKGADPAIAPEYSGTNTHEAGVDEPDLVKTDGKRVVTISGGVMRVIDVATRRQVGRLDLAGDSDGEASRKFAWTPTNMLFSGDRALVLVNDYYRLMPTPVDDVNSGFAEDRETVEPTTPAGPRLVLVDLAGKPRVISSYHVDGALVDAREVGGTARVVVRSGPRLVFPPWRGDSTNAKRTEANQKVIDKSTLDDWLPRFEVTTGNRTMSGRVPCDAVVRPETFTGANMLTVLSFDLAAESLGSGDPLTLVADGDTVYGTGTSLYVASDQRWRGMPFADGTSRVKPAEVTDIYRFDISQPGRPRFTAGGTVPGYLINQYAMSEWNGRLRVATTTDPWGRGGRSESTVHVLAPVDRDLTTIGKVGGLGKGERIYAVRFVGSIGYVVTFRQVDPLYTIDLSDPTKPTVRGALKIPGYSAYLHPAADNKVIGIGRDADDLGRTRGVQISLFDVADLDDPTRVARFTVDNGHSEAEFDPHAFLYWPTDGLLVVPLQVYGPAGQPEVGALVLRVTGNRIVDLGQISHPVRWELGTGAVRRSLVIDQTLWTVSDAGVMVNDSHTLTRVAWIPNR